MSYALAARVAFWIGRSIRVGFETYKIYKLYKISTRIADEIGTIVLDGIQYVLHKVGVVYETSGGRTFFVDDSGTIHNDGKPVSQSEANSASIIGAYHKDQHGDLYYHDASGLAKIEEN